MTIDQDARAAARAALDAAEDLPLVPLHTVDRVRRRRSWTAAAVGLGTVVVAIVLATAVRGPEESPVATDPTTTVVPSTTVPETGATTVPDATGTTIPAQQTSTTIQAEAPLPDGVGLEAPIPAGGVDADVVLYDYFTISPVSGGGIGDPIATAPFGGVLEGQRTIAADGQGGFVTLYDQSSLLWWQAGSDRPVLIEDPSLEAGLATYASLIEVAAIGGETTAIVTLDPGPTVGAVDCASLPLTRAVSLESGNSIDWSEGSWSFPGGCHGPPVIARGTTSVYILAPDWANVPSDPESGRPLAPVPVTHLVVDGPNNQRRIPLTTDDRPFATIHDFDGTRVLVSIEPYEPALPPRLFTIIDLECETCDVTFESPGFANGALVRPNIEALQACAPIESDLPDVSQPELDDETAGLRESILMAIADCDFDELDRLTGKAVFEINHQYAGEIGWEAAVGAVPQRLLGDVIGSFLLPPDQVDGAWQWPGFAFRQWDDLSPQQQAAAEEFHRDDFDSQSEFHESFGEWFDDVGNGVELGTIVITYDPAADTWRFEYWLS